MISHENNFSLVQLIPGSSAVVSQVLGERDVRAKLCAMGFTPGTPVLKCSYGDSSGCFKVIVRNSSVIIDSNVAAGIFCKESDSQFADDVCTLCEE